MLRLRFVLIMLAFALPSSAGDPDNLSIDFRTAIKKFVKKHSTDFRLVTETTYLFNKDVPTSWDTTITLKRKTTTKNKYDQKVYQRLFLGFYQYETNEQCSAAVDSLLNSFGGGCDKFKWGDTGRGLKSIPTIYLVNESPDNRMYDPL